MIVEVQAKDKGTAADVNALVNRTNKENPKPEDMRALKAVFDESPGIALQIGNLRRSVFSTVLETAVGKSAMAKEATERYVKKMKEEMNYEISSFVERLLIDEIIMRWLRLQVMEQAHYTSTTGSHSMKEGLYSEKRLHLTQKRYLDSIETLAKVRKMIAQTQAHGARMFKDLVETESC